ncbi:hypothetical protein BDV95DRAFT_204884 [Massariosphaeria phaeospora]|uniref:Uncharacterized protein n=1 Tax=Massariosphaeria phaeospora TaxID=100035 RepID=A0A7C8M8L5_9PLEO|nr:hypothetical protein BDV95DRAFT_204884 [Massariosphaeria phaeospora]
MQRMALQASLEKPMLLLGDVSQFLAAGDVGATQFQKKSANAGTSPIATPQRSCFPRQVQCACLAQTQFFYMRVVFVETTASEQHRERGCKSFRGLSLLAILPKSVLPAFPEPCLRVDVHHASPAYGRCHTSGKPVGLTAGPRNLDCGANGDQDSGHSEHF